MNYVKFYDEIFSALEKKYGKLDNETITPIVGFSVGGPVSLSKIETKKLYVTCELSVHPNQKPSSQGLQYELFSVGNFSEEWCRSVFTALGNLSLEAELGDKHTINISGITEGPEIVKLRLFSQSTINNKQYGVYEVLAK